LHGTPQQKPTCNWKLPSNIPMYQSDRVITYEEKNNFFTLESRHASYLQPEPGPNCRGRARRKGATAAFLDKQLQVIAGSEQALALYAAALRELTEADTFSPDAAGTTGNR